MATSGALMRLNIIASLIWKFANGLSTQEEEKWAKHRKIINPAFHVEKLKIEKETTLGEIPTNYSSGGIRNNPNSPRAIRRYTNDLVQMREIF
ncbi:hypothetical protein LguiB_002047 [Lonicera macranthoides]